MGKKTACKKKSPNIQVTEKISCQSVAVNACEYEIWLSVTELRKRREDEHRSILQDLGDLAGRQENPLCFC